MSRPDLTSVPETRRTMADVGAEVADTLRKALDVLRERGWCQDELVDAKGHVCGVGAVEVAANTRVIKRYPIAARDMLATVVEEQWPDRMGELSGGCPIPVFNDHPDTTQDDVERAFEKAICRAEEMVG